MDKETVLHDILRTLGKNGLTIAFSGGTDSVFLLNAAVNVLGKEKVKAVFIKSELTAFSEEKQAQQIAQKFNVPFEILHLNVLNEIRFNPISRCYLCKKKMFSELLKIKGVGPKVADCVMLFAFSRTGSFPVDTWLKKVYIENFNGNETNTVKISKYFTDRFSQNSGFLQQYLFNYKRNLEKSLK